MVHRHTQPGLPADALSAAAATAAAAANATVAEAADRSSSPDRQLCSQSSHSDRSDSLHDDCQSGAERSSFIDDSNAESVSGAEDGREGHSPTAAARSHTARQSPAVANGDAVTGQKRPRIVDGREDCEGDNALPAGSPEPLELPTLEHPSLEQTADSDGSVEPEAVSGATLISKDGNLGSKVIN